MKRYNPKIIEKKWQKKWYTSKLFTAKNTGKNKFYLLFEFPYPSGDGLHVGHCRPYIALDIIARKRRLEGQNVLFPIGWDAFGLPTENYAIKKGIHPTVATKKNTNNFRRQMNMLGLSLDWSREINTTDPAYYKWTQWIFIKLFEKGLAYKDSIAINWCPSCKIGLANEEVVQGNCERCGTKVEKRDKDQWLIKITKYADRLIKDLDLVSYPERVKTQQKNWIGRSEGAEIDFTILGGKEKITIFTTRADTIFGAAFLVLAPEHPLVTRFSSNIKNWSEVSSYITTATKKSEEERTSQEKEKTGVKLDGITAINPANQEELSVWVGDFVLAYYGTGAVFGDAHDSRDVQFANNHGLVLRETVVPNIVDKRNPPVPGKKIVERRNVHAVVKDRATGKYLALAWKKFNWVTFPMGGIEDGEDVVEAARREVREETGFTNLTLVKVLDGQVRAEYFAAHKDENRISYTTAVVFELINQEKVEISEKEKQNHDIIWLDESKLNYEHMTHAEVEMWKEKMASPGFWTGEGVLINSGKFSGQSTQTARKEIIALVGGKTVVKYKLRDWVFSRQHYWGEPIPMIYCEKCKWQTVPEKDLPVKLPNVKKYQPTDTGESPLSAIEKWVKVKCPKCNGPAKRETDTMPNWAGSNWYYLRYTDPKNSKKLADSKALKYWMPVDWYNGGMEHTTLHLLYSRFIFKFLWDIGAVPKEIGNEPYKKRTSHGIVLAEGGVKMSKSRGNVVNPDQVVEEYGADTLRIYEMFMGPFEQMIPWDQKGIIGVRRFLDKIYVLAGKLNSKARREKSNDKNLESLLHKTIKKVSEDIEAMKFNTAVSAMMEFVNTWNSSSEGLDKNNITKFLAILSPFAPHLTEELWQMAGYKGLCMSQSWPNYDPALIKDKTVTMAVQVNGKLRDTIEVASQLSEEEIKKFALAREKVKPWLDGKEVKKIIVVSERLINIVV